MTDQEKGQWYVVYTKAHQEEFAQLHLRLRGLDVFFPRLLLPKSVRKRRRVVPLFPNYLFVQIHLSKEFDYVVWSPGVKRFVAFNDVPMPIEEQVVNYLMEQAEMNGLITARSDLKIGQQVRISGGPFDGLDGIIQKPPDAKGRVRILMQLLSRQVNVEVSAESIQGEWIASGLPARRAENEK